MCGDLLQVPPAHGTAALAAVQQECLSVLVHSSPGMPGCCDGLGLYVHGSLCLQHSHKSSSIGFLREQDALFPQDAVMTGSRCALPKYLHPYCKNNSSRMVFYMKGINWPPASHQYLSFSISYFLSLLVAVKITKQVFKKCSCVL